MSNPTSKLQLYQILLILFLRKKIYTIANVELLRHVITTFNVLIRCHCTFYFAHTGPNYSYLLVLFSAFCYDSIVWKYW